MNDEGARDLKKNPRNITKQRMHSYICWQGTEIIMITLNGVCAFQNPTYLTQLAPSSASRTPPPHPHPVRPPQRYLSTRHPTAQPYTPNPPPVRQVNATHSSKTASSPF